MNLLNWFKRLGKFLVSFMVVFIMLTSPSSVHSQSYYQSDKIAGASAGFIGPDGWYDSWVSVSRVWYREPLGLGPRPIETTWLQFEVTVEVGQFIGQGFIPSEAFRVIGQNGDAVLDVDFSTLPEFEVYMCINESNGSYVCNLHYSGTISMEWTGNGARREEMQGQIKYFVQGEQPHTQSYNSWMMTADAQGTMFGYSFSGDGSVSGVADKWGPY